MMMSESFEYANSQQDFWKLNRGLGFRGFGVMCLYFLGWVFVVLGYELAVFKNIPELSIVYAEWRPDNICQSVLDNRLCVAGSLSPHTVLVLQGFKQAAQLKNHSLIHVAGTDLVEKESMSGRHWFAQSQCDICKRTFANQKSLQCHIEAVHDKV